MYKSRLIFAALLAMQLVLWGCPSDDETPAPTPTPAPAIIPTPASPSDLIATAVTNSEVDLAWRDNSSDETSFVIERKVGSGSYAVLDTIGEDEESYADISVNVGMTYTYRIRGCNGGGCSDWAESNAVTTSDADAPTAPSSLSATTISSSRIDLSWTGSTDNVAVTEYAVFRGGVEIAQVSAPTTTYSNTGLSEATSYSYTVKARDAAGNLSSASNTASATTSDVTAPSAPSSLSATAISSTRIDLSWTGSTDNVAVTKYIVYRAGVEIAQVDPPTTAYSNTGLAEATSYSYTVKAKDAATNLSSASNTAGATTNCNAPTAPSDVTATIVSETAIDVAWTDNASNETGFELDRHGEDWESLTGPAANAVSYEDESVPNTDFSYSYRIRACKACGCSDYAYSSEVTHIIFTTLLNGDLSASGLGGSSLELSRSSDEYYAHNRSENGIASVGSDQAATPAYPFYAPHANNPGWGGVQITGDRENSLVKSEDFRNWDTGSNILMTANAGTSPSGTNTATQITDAGSGNGYVEHKTDTPTAANKTFVFSVFLQSASGSNVNVKLFLHDNDTGESYGSSTLVVGTEWMRYDYSATFSSGAANVVIPRILITTSGGSIYAWGAQLENPYDPSFGSGVLAPSAYMPTNGSAATSAGDNLVYAEALPMTMERGSLSVWVNPQFTNSEMGTSQEKWIVTMGAGGLGITLSDPNNYNGVIGYYGGSMRISSGAGGYIFDWNRYEWMQIVLTWDLPDTGFSLYVNGTNVDNEDGFGIDIPSAEGLLFGFPNSAVGGSSGGEMIIGKTAVRSYPMPADEISANYASELANYQDQ